MSQAIQFSIVVPAYNEEKLIAQTLIILRECIEHIPIKGELIVVDNNSTDSTAKIAEQLGARVIFEPVNKIARARNCGARAAQGKYLFFVDADSCPSVDAIIEGLKQMDSGKVCAGGSTVKFDRDVGYIATKLLAISNKTQAAKQLALGTFLYCTQTAFKDVGGFDERFYSGEDITLSRNLRRWGQIHQQEVHICSQHPVTTSARKFDHSKRILLQLLISLIPYSRRFRVFSGYWYKRNH